MVYYGQPGRHMEVRSGCPRASPIKNDLRLKMNVLKEKFCWAQQTVKRNYFSILKKSGRVKEMVFLSKTCG